ncbi:MAG: helix-turn-helix transcriptional regulator [Lentisphaerae bacterium]|jgi:transcriptional regulator with XRE-family HTH domain|nr:helix-turn-helix transcriptional regulator [Lentisphaerota bacterium]
MNFGELLKDARIRNRLTLRQCSAHLGVDASNWSKVERGVNPAPKDIGVLESWAAFFHLEASERQAFFDAAALSRREIPQDIASNTRLLRALPAFFRAVRGNEMNQEKMDQFISDLRAVNTPDKESNE